MADSQGSEPFSVFGQSLAFLGRAHLVEKINVLPGPSPAGATCEGALGCGSPVPTGGFGTALTVGSSASLHGGRRLCSARLPESREEPSRGWCCSAPVGLVPLLCLCRLFSVGCIGKPHPRRRHFGGCPGLATDGHVRTAFLHAAWRRPKRRLLYFLCRGRFSWLSAARCVEAPVSPPSVAVKNQTSPFVLQVEDKETINNLDTSSSDFTILQEIEEPSLEPGTVK